MNGILLVQSGDTYP